MPMTSREPQIQTASVAAGLSVLVDRRSRYWPKIPSLSCNRNRGLLPHSVACRSCC